MENKKLLKWVKTILGLFFVAYISLYTLNVSGYYDGNIRRKVEFTESQIRQFEEDIKSGEEVDVKNYLKDQNKDYTNTASRVGYTISSNIESFLNKGIKKIINILGKILS